MGDETSVRLAISMSRGVGTVAGVALLNGKPLGSLMVVLVPEDPENHSSRFRRDQSATDGTFTLPTIVPASIRCWPSRRLESEMGQRRCSEPYLAGGEVVEVVPNGKCQVKVNAQ